MFGLQSRLPVSGETWKDLRKLDLAGRLEAIRNADFDHVSRNAKARGMSEGR